MGCVLVNFSGRFANCLFQYCSARIFAEEQGHAFLCRWPLNDWLEATMEHCLPTTYASGQIPTIEINDGNFLEEIAMRYPRTGEAVYSLNGYFQLASIYKPFETSGVRLWFDWKSKAPIDDSQICMHVRLTDHGRGRLYLDPQWYAGILERETFKKLVIVTDDPFASGYFDAFKKWNPRIVYSPNAMDDFNLIRAHTKIIIGPSSFAWWAAYTGNAKTIYQWKRDQELPHIQYQLQSTPDRVVIPVDGKFYWEAKGEPRPI